MMRTAARLRKKLSDFFFVLDEERLIFRSATVEAACLSSCIFTPILLWLLISWGLDELATPDAALSFFRPWIFFFSFAAVVPPIALFWGAPAAVLYAGFTSFFFVIWLLLSLTLEYWTMIPLAAGAISALLAIAGRAGELRHAVDGELAYWKLRLGDLESARNVFLAQLVDLDQRIDSIDLLIDKLSRLAESSAAIERSLSLPQVAETVANRAREMFGRGRALVYRFAPSGSQLLHATPPLKPGEGDSGEDFNPIARLRRENILIVDIEQNYQTAPQAASARKFDAIMMVPLVTGNDTWGVLRMESDRPRDFDRDDLRALAALAIPSTLALQNADLFAAIEQRAVTDGLTGLFRRHFFEKRLEAECARARRNKSPLAIVFFDVDRFKSINDRFGHSQGDTVLRIVAGTVHLAMGKSSLVGRYGGEEFVAMLPEAHVEEARDLAEKTRHAVEMLVVPGLPERVTISAGVAAMPDHGDQPKTLTERADAALYESKKFGRNRVTIA